MGNFRRPVVTPLVRKTLILFGALIVGLILSAQQKSQAGTENFEMDTQIAGTTANDLIHARTAGGRSSSSPDGRTLPPKFPGWLVAPENKINPESNSGALMMSDLPCTSLFPSNGGGLTLVAGEFALTEVFGLEATVNYQRRQFPGFVQERFSTGKASILIERYDGSPSFRVALENSFIYPDVAMSCIYRKKS